jgi:hypothetical protein
VSLIVLLLGISGYSFYSTVDGTMEDHKLQTTSYNDLLELHIHQLQLDQARVSLFRNILHDDYGIILKDSDEEVHNIIKSFLYFIASLIE